MCSSDLVVLVEVALEEAEAFLEAVHHHPEEAEAAEAGGAF